MGAFEKICDRVFLVGGSGLTDGSDCLVYAVALGDLVLIDCGAGRSWKRMRGNLEAAGLEPGNLHTLILTHAHVDHIGAAAEIKAGTGCRIVAHAADAPAIATGDPGFTVSHLYGVELKGVDVDRVVEGDGRLDFSGGHLDLVHTPGHTPGSLSVVFEGKEGRVLFGQDVHGPFSSAFQSDLAAWESSMQHLLDLEADILCEGHFGVFRPASEVRRFIEGQLAAGKSMMPVPVPM